MTNHAEYNSQLVLLNRFVTITNTHLGKRTKFCSYGHHFHSFTLCYGKYSAAPLNHLPTPLLSVTQKHSLQIHTHTHSELFAPVLPPQIHLALKSPGF